MKSVYHSYETGIFVCDIRLRDKDDKVEQKASTSCGKSGITIRDIQYSDLSHLSSRSLSAQADQI